MFASAAPAESSASPMPVPRIFTIGHSNHEVETFFRLLSTYRITDLVDVRSIPSSGRFPHFKKRSLEDQCSRRGISYRHCPALGNKVGGIASLLKCVCVRATPDYASEQRSCHTTRWPGGPKLLLRTLCAIWIMICALEQLISRFK